jgi:excisionase family DNA binding protein
LTTFQVAKHLGVSPPTIVNWIEDGFLKAHRTPGGHRRITKEDIIAFARERNYPLADLVGPSPQRSGSRVLLVDDNSEFCEMVKTYLEARGNFVVEVAYSGFAAGLTIGRFKPDVVLMDLEMDGMDGYEALKLIKDAEETQHVPVLACSSMTDERLERVRREPFYGWVDKLKGLDRILEAVRDAVNGRPTNRFPRPDAPQARARA